MDLCGFAFTLLFAAISHAAIDGIANFQTWLPIIFLAILLLSYRAYHKLQLNEAGNMQVAFK